MQCSGAFILLFDNVLTSCSKHHRDHIKNQICGGRGHRHLKKKRSVKALALMTSLWACLWSTTLACPQWTSLLACPPTTTPIFFLLRFFSHIYTAQGKNDLSAALNSLHFYSPEWTGSTKGDIIFSGFDWPPPCHRMTSCTPLPNTSQPAPAYNQPSPACSWMLGCQDNRARPRLRGRTWQCIPAWLSIMSSGSVALVFAVNSLGK